MNKIEMKKKVLIFCVLVMCVMSLNASAGIVAYYSYDVGGTDDSGNGHGCTLQTGSSIVSDAERGNVMDVTGGTGAYINSSYGTDTWIAQNLAQSNTIMMWVKMDSWGTTAWVPSLFWKGADYSLSRRNLTSTWRWGIKTDGTAAQATYSTPDYADGTWHHVAATTNTATRKSKIYIDAVEMGSGDFTGNLFLSAANTYIANGLVGRVDNVIFFDEALDDAAIQSYMLPDPASNPAPSNGATEDASTFSGLSWAAGFGATSHDVYFGTNLSEVANAQRLAGDINGDGIVDIDDLAILVGQWLTNPGVVTPTADVAYSQYVDMEDFAVVAADWGLSAVPEFKGNQTTATYDPGTLQEDVTYYWRIDEVNGYGTTTGTVWSFTTSLILPDPTIFNTGLDNNSNPLGDRVLDPHWTLTSSPDPTYTGPETYTVKSDEFPIGPWLANTSESMWICPRQDATEVAAGTYIYQLQFDLTGYDVTNLRITGQYSVDDSVTDVEINGTSTGISGVMFDRWTPFSISSGLVAGINTLEFFVNNGESGPSGLRVELEITTYTPTSTGDIVFPEYGVDWDTKTPAELGLDGAKLDQLAANIGGNGMIIRQGYVVKTWGDPSNKDDWASAAKPVLSTMLFYAIEEGLLSGVDDLISDQGWNMNVNPADRDNMTFYHLANMISGYARAEDPGQRWAYNDTAIMLYAKTLFDKVYNAVPNTAATNANRLGALGFQDGSIFGSWRGDYGIGASIRDFARIGWLWCNKGYWDGSQLLPQSYFDNYMKAQVPSSMLRTSASDSDYLGVGTYGGGTDQWAPGPGVYGFNWWCNDDVVNWPDAPADTVQANGHWGNEVVTVIPSLSVVMAYRTSNTRSHTTTGSSSSLMNQDLKLLTEACPPPPEAGYIQVDPTNSARMVYSNTYVNGRLKPVCFAGPGDPEDFFYNDTANNISLLTSRPARCTYITAVLQDFGGGNPGTGTALDAKLNEWEGYITQLENAGVITVFFFFDDSQGLTANWEELVDKCVAKFKHHKLLIWSVAEEYSEAITPSQVSAVAARIKSQDTNDHIVGVHQLGGITFDFMSDPNIDMFLMQTNSTSASGIHSDVKNSNANGSKIINMAEAPDHAKKTQTVVRQWNWAAVMGGASAAQVLWMGRASDPADWNTQGKYDDCARLMDFMESTNLNVTSNRDDLARGETDYVLADPGNVYIVYGDSVSSSLGVNVVGADYKVKWFDPIDGNWVDEGSQTLSSGDHYFAKPATIGTEAALYLEAELVVVPAEILPNDDCTVRGTTNYDNEGEFGLMVKNATDTSWIEFTLGSDPVNEATLTLFQADGGCTDYWTITVKGAEFDFDETTFTGTDVSSWTSVGSIPDVKADNTYHDLDMTTFYNSNLGKTVTLRLYRDVQPGGNGPIFGDKEGTRIDTNPSQGPKISIN